MNQKIKIMKRYIAIILIAIPFIFSACTEEIHIDLDSTYDRIVIEGYFTDEYKVHQVKITKSADYFSNASAPAITGATVTISDGTNTFNLTEIEDGLYETDTMAGVPGNTYTLNASIDGTIYTASSYMFTCPPMDSIGFARNIWDDEWIDVLIYAQEPGDEINHYAWRAYKNDTLVTDTLHEVEFSDDVFINGSYVNGVEVQYVQAEIGDTIMLEMHSITEDYYEYMLKVMLETVWNGGPFDGPPANFYGNLSNEALGFFAVYSVQWQTGIIPPDIPDAYED